MGIFNRDPFKTGLSWDSLESDKGFSSSGTGNPQLFKNAGQVNLNKNPGWMNSVAPQYSASNPYDVGVGGYQIDMRDPRIMMALLAAGTGGGAFLLPAAGMAAYGAGRQIANQRIDRKLEKEYLPRAGNEARLAKQRSIYGGVEGGLGEAQTQSVFETIIQQLKEAKRGIRTKQQEEEMMGINALVELLPFLSGV